jgi:hypothetical protein
MVQICKYKYEVAYVEPIQGKSEIIEVDGATFVGTKGGKAIWVKGIEKKINVGGNWKHILFSLAISNMLMGSVRKIKENGKIYITFEMGKGIHWKSTWGKKKADGTPMFKVKPKCWNCSNYNFKQTFSKAGQGTYVQGSGTSGSGRRSI